MPCTLSCYENEPSNKHSRLCSFAIQQVAQEQSKCLLFFTVAVVTRRTLAQPGSCPIVCSMCFAGSLVVLCNTPGSTTNHLPSVPDLPDDVKSSVEELLLSQSS